MTMMPPTDPGKASYAKDREAIWKEIRALWRAMGNPATPASGPNEIVFSYAGTPVEGVLAPPYQMRVTTVIDKVVASVGSSGGSTSVVTVYLNGEVMSTVTVDPDEPTGFDLPGTPVTEGDVITAAVTTLGDYDTDFTIQVLW